MPGKPVALVTQDGTPVSSLAFGTMQFGGNADRAESRAMYDASREAGINHFDTAVSYTEGRSEALLGECLQGERDKIFLATKVGYVGGAARTNILAQFDQSRRQLGGDVVDLLYMHRFDPDTPLEETFETLAELQQRRSIRFIGVSNYAAWQVMKAQTAARSFGTQIDVIQPMFSLVKRQVEVEIIPMAQDQGINLVPYSPLGGGLLSGKYASGGTGRLTEDHRYKARYAQGWMHETALSLVNLANEWGIEAATLAVAWVMAHPSQPCPIISGRSVEQLKPSLAAKELVLSQDQYTRLSAISPEPAPATDRLEEA